MSAFCTIVLVVDVRNLDTLTCTCGKGRVPKYREYGNRKSTNEQAIVVKPNYGLYKCRIQCICVCECKCRACTGVTLVVL